MNVAHHQTEATVRSYTQRDEEEVLKLLRTSLGGGPGGSRSPEFFRWKHLENPFGESFMLLAEADGRVVGFRAFMRWRFTTWERNVSAVRAVDTATHPDFQRRGIFSRLTLEALDALRSDVAFVFNTPNKKSLPGYLKMGWQVVCSVPIRIRVRHPFRFGRNVRALSDGAITPVGRPILIEAAPAGDVLDEAEDLSILLERSDRFGTRLATSRTVEYLRWRYGSAPLLDYRAIRDDGGLAIFRVRRRGGLVEATLAELIVAERDVRHARSLLHAVARAANVDHVTMTFPSGSTPDRAVRRRTIRAPGGMTLVANPLGTHLEPDPTKPSSWALSLGDLEVF